MNFLDDSGKLSSYINNIKNDKKESKFVNKKNLIIFISIFTFVIVLSFFIFKKPLNAIIESNTFSKGVVMAENVRIIKNNNIDNLNKIAGVKLINPNIYKARVLAEVAPSRDNLVSGQITSTQDASVTILYNFLVAHNSPMAPYASDFVKYAKMYNIDWKVLVAISGVESGFGRVIPQSTSGVLSYNAWGWTGGSYNFGGFASFGSWPVAIQSIAQGISSSYGNESPYVMQPIYCPPNPGWASEVQSYINQL